MILFKDTKCMATHKQIIIIILVLNVYRNVQIIHRKPEDMLSLNTLN